MFRPDLPIKSSKEDLLARASFSLTLADAIISYSNKDSVVTALYGSWGSGKSSVVNMVLERIEESSLSMAPANRPIVVKFNPWNYSDQNQLVAQFFRSMSVSLKRGEPGEDAKKAGEQLEVYSEFFKPLALIPDPTGVGPLLASAMAVVMKKVGVATTAWGKMKSKDLDQIRKDLDALLAKKERKILIVIDDIDRLNNVEIRQIFQLVKTLGDFPNTVYLLAFDRNVVVKALSHVQEGSGDEYLEKIVQIPFQLPTISRAEVEKVLFGQLDELIKDVPELKWDHTHWGNLYQGGLRFFFGTVRDVNRFLNSLRFSFAMVKDEVNPVDFVAVTALQVFEPVVYDRIRENADLFAGIFTSGQHTQDQKVKVRCDEVISHSIILSKEQMLELLSELFPKLESIYNNMGYGSDFLEGWRRNGRVCSPDKFDIFFRLSIPVDEISTKEIESILAIGGNESAFSERLLNLNESGRAIRFLERMGDYTKEAIPADHIPAILKVLMDIGDLFPEGQEGGIFARDTSMKVMRLLHQLVRRYENQHERYDLLRTAIERSNRSLYTIVREVGLLGQQHGKFRVNSEPLDPEEKRTVGFEDLIELERLAVDKTRIWAKDGRLRLHPRLVSILYTWKQWSIEDSDKIAKFIEEMIKEDEGLLTLISAFENKAFIQGMSDHVGRIEHRINLKSIEDFVPVKSIEPRVRNIASPTKYNSITPQHQRAVTVFLNAIEGKNEDW